MITKIEDGKHDISLTGECPHCSQPVRLTVPEDKASIFLLITMAELFGLDWNVTEKEQKDEQ